MKFTFNKKILILLLPLLLATVIIVLLINFPAPETQGFERKEDIPWKYIVALKKNDAAGLVRMTPEYNRVATWLFIKEKMKELGGEKFQDVQIEYRQSESPFHYYIYLTGFKVDDAGNKTPFTDKIGAEKAETKQGYFKTTYRWFLF